MGNSDLRNEQLYNLFAVLKEADERNKILDNAPPIPEEVRGWLGRLCLLYGVPFAYLVPSDQPLEMESLRFFYFDPQWLESLLDGALSVGRASETRLLLGKAMAENFLAEIVQEAKKVRPALQGKPGDGGKPTVAQSTWQLTGFILRSEVVAGWRGLEIAGYGVTGDISNEKPLPILRLERLSEDILLCIFEGLVKTLIITQPSEALHFGVQLKNGVPPSYEKSIQSVSVKQDGKTFHVSVPLRNNARRVVDVKVLADDIATKLGQGISSAEFALEMVERPVRYTISIRKNEVQSTPRD